MSKKGFYQQQHDKTDCGAACLASVAASYALHLPLARIRQFAGTDRNGTNALGMVEAARRMGFQAKAVRASAESLSSIPLPAIAHVVRGNLQHYVVLNRVNDLKIETMDPEDGKLHKIASEGFLAEWSGVLILMVPDALFHPGKEQTSPLVRLIQILRPHRSVLFYALLASLLFSLLGLATALYIEKIVDGVLTSRNTELLNMLTLGTALLLIARVLTGSIKNTLGLRTGQILDSGLILGYYRHLLQLPQTFFDTMRTGEILSRVNDAVKIRFFINNVLLELCINALIFLCTTGVMVFYSWKLTLVLYAGFPLFFALYHFSDKFNKRILRKNMESSAELESHLVESVHTVSTIRSTGMEDTMNLRTEKRFVQLMSDSYSAGQNNLVAGSLTQLLAGGMTILSLWYGSRLVLSDILSMGELMSFFALTGYLLGPVQALIGANQSIQDALIAADRLFQIMDLEQIQTQAGKIELSAGDSSDLLFKDVTFRYGNRKALLENFDLLIPKGKITAVVGESGSGKSTLAALLHKKYPVQSGRIKIGGYDIRHLTEKSLHEHIAVVPQDIHLFSGTILENIATGCEEPDFRRIIQLCEMLGLHTFIEHLPESYYTRLGENGLSLSGGEKQRLALVRALYKDPAVLILDEVTASLDALAEQKVQETLLALRNQGKTILIIAHRLTTTRTADHIVVLSQGRILEKGTPGELLQARGAYHRLIKAAQHLY